MIRTNWTTATTNYQEALLALQACKGSCRTCWLELRENGDQDFPIKIVNPVLNDPFAWEFSYGTYMNPELLLRHNFLNDTERDLTYNWIARLWKSGCDRVVSKEPRINRRVKCRYWYMLSYSYCGCAKVS